MVVSLVGCVIILALRPLILDFYRDKLTETAIYYLGSFYHYDNLAPCGRRHQYLPYLWLLQRWR